MLLLFVILSSSFIPKEYQELAKKAKSTQSKIPKALRQETKLPGIYEGDKYRFKLLKTLTSIKTNDIKGFATDLNHCAIVKRKSFSLEDGYAIINPKTQEIFIMNHRVAEEDNVIIYNSTKGNIFSLMTDFVLESSTDLQPHQHLRFQGTRSPKASINIPFLWDLIRDRPILFNLFETDVQCGTGCSFMIGVTTKISFKSIWDVSLSFQFVFEGKFGAEIVVPDDCKIEFEDKVIKDLQFPIPGLSFEKDFLDLKLSLGAFTNFALEFTDLSLVIPTGFDYFKGYSVQAHKYFEITPTSTTDSPWEISVSMLSSDDTISSVVRKMLGSYLTATLQLRPFLSLEFVLGELNIVLEAGVKIPFAFTVDLDQQACKFPYLHGTLSIPIAMYFDFSGLSYKDFSIIKSASKEVPLKTFEFEPFCIGRPNTNENPEEQIPRYTLIIQSDDIYEIRANGVAQVEKEIIVGAHSDFNEYMKLYCPLTTFSGSNNKTKLWRFYYATNLTDDHVFTWAINYTLNNEMMMSNTASLKMSDVHFVDNSFNQLIAVDLLGNQQDMTYINASIYKAQFVPIGNPFSPQSKKFCAEITIDSMRGHHFGLFYVDDNNHFAQDEEAFFYLDYSLDPKHGSMKEFCNSTQYQLLFALCNSSSPTKFHIRLNFYLKCGSEIISISTFYTPLIDKGQYDWDGLSWSSIWYSFFNKPDNSDLCASGEVIYENGEKLLIDEYVFDVPLLLPHDWYYVIPITNDITIVFALTHNINTLVVESSFTNELPELMMIAEITYVSERTIEWQDPFHCLFYVLFLNEDIFQAVKMPIPLEFRHCKLFLGHQTKYPNLMDPLTFQGENIHTISQEYVWIDIDGQEEISFFVSRKFNSSCFYYIDAIFCQFDAENLFLTASGSNLYLGSIIPTLIIFPLYEGYEASIFNSEDGMVVHTQTLPFDSEFLKYNKIEFLFRFDIEPTTLFVMNAMSVISEDEPYISIDLTLFKSFYDTYHYVPYAIFSKYAKEIRCQFGDEIYDEELNGELFASFLFVDIDWDNLAILQCSALCLDNPNGAGCEIEYPAPEITGFHLIQYPNRDGISITGRGFLAELIKVEKGKPFIYSKTYNQSIQTIRAYTNEEVMTINVHIKVIDNDNASFTHMIKTRTFCIFDNEKRYLPFSRKHVESDIMSFLDEIGVSQDIDFSYFINDENGCIVFDAKYIKSNEFSISRKACDFFANESGIFDSIDTSSMHFSPVSSNSKTITFIISAVISVISVLIVILITWRVCKKKCKKPLKPDLTTTSSVFSDLLTN